MRELNRRFNFRFKIEFYRGKIRILFYRIIRIYCGISYSFDRKSYEIDRFVRKSIFRLG